MMTVRHGGKQKNKMMVVRHGRRQKNGMIMIPCGNCSLDIGQLKENDSGNDMQRGYEEKRYENRDDSGELITLERQGDAY